MIIYFVAVEAAVADFFNLNLPDHETRFVDRLDWVEEDAEIVSVFINEIIDENFLLDHPRLRLVATRSHSVEHIDLPACHARGVAICSVPAHGEITVAEHTFALILALSRRLREVMTLPQSGHFSYEATRGFDLAGKTLGIVGMGRIGRRVATLARGFSMKVLAFDPVPQPAARDELEFSYSSFAEVLASSHVISLHASLTAETYHMLDAAALAQCRPGVLVINTARGALVETQALREALDSGQVGGAGLDVLEDERIMRDSVASILSAEIVQRLRSDAVASESLDADRLREMQALMLGDAILSRNNVVFTPHVAFNSVEAVEQLCEVTLANLRAFVGGHPANLV